MHNHLTHSDDFINAGFKVTKTLWRSTPNGLETKRTLSALLQRLNQGRFPRIAGHFGRRGKNTQLPPAELLRHSAYSRIAGYEDVNDAERASQDPTLRLIGSEKTWNRGAALTFRLQTFETEMLAEAENFRSLARIKRELIGKANAIDAPQRIVLDMDSTKIPVYLLSPAAAVQ